jgi:hypothetical protein
MEAATLEFYPILPINLASHRINDRLSSSIPGVKGGRRNRIVGRPDIFYRRGGELTVKEHAPYRPPTISYKPLHRPANE